MQKYILLYPDLRQVHIAHYINLQINVLITATWVHLFSSEAGVVAIILFIAELRKLTYYLMTKHARFARFSCLNTLRSYFIYNRNEISDLYLQ